MIEYCQIEISKNKVVRVSTEDFDVLSSFNWAAFWNASGNAYYATRRGQKRLGEVGHVRMNRQVMNFPLGMMVDHINGDTLDNRRENLRIATRAQNQQNHKGFCTNTSGFNGVYKQGNKWRVRISVNNRLKSLGMFDSFEEACVARKKAATIHYGEFSRHCEKIN